MRDIFLMLTEVLAVRQSSDKRRSQDRKRCFRRNRIFLHIVGPRIPTGTLQDRDERMREWSIGTY